MSYANEYLDELTERLDKFNEVQAERDELKQTIEQMRIIFFRLKLENQILRWAFNKTRAGNDDTLDLLDKMIEVYDMVTCDLSV